MISQCSEIFILVRFPHFLFTELRIDSSQRHLTSDHLCTHTERVAFLQTLREKLGAKAAADQEAKFAAEGATKMTVFWIEQIDRRTKLPFYWHTGLRETSWDRPASFWRLREDKPEAEYVELGH